MPSRSNASNSSRRPKHKSVKACFAEVAQKIVTPIKEKLPSKKQIAEILQAAKEIFTGFKGAIQSAGQLLTSNSVEGTLTRTSVVLVAVAGLWVLRHPIYNSIMPNSIQIPYVPDSALAPEDRQVKLFYNNPDGHMPERPPGTVRIELNPQHKQ